MHLVKKRVFFTFWGVLISLLNTYAQDPTFSQYYASSLYLNPAMAAVEPSWAVSLNHRSQWRSIVSNPYVTTQASFLVPFYSKGTNERHWGGAGISVYNDRAGIGFLSNTGANANFAYNVPLGIRHNLMLGVQLGVVYKSVDIGNMQWGTQYDPNSPDGFSPELGNPAINSNLINNKVFADIGAGFLYYYNAERDYEDKSISAFFGLSAYHLNKPNESLIDGETNNLPVFFKGHAGVEWNLSSRLNFSPNVLVAYQNSQNQINTGAYFTYLFSEQKNVLAPTDFILGGWYRVKDAIIASIGFGNSYYTLGFSYDINSSSLKYSTKGKGAYEISLKITKPHFKRKVRYHTPRI